MIIRWTRRLVVSLIFGSIGLLVLILGLVAWWYLYGGGGDEDPTEGVVAPEIVTTTSTTSSTQTSDTSTPGLSSANQGSETTAVNPSDSPDTISPTSTIPTTTEPSTTTSATIAPDSPITTFEAELTADTTARFFIDETLRGSPFTVEAIADQVLGRILIDRENPANSQLGEILVNARTFTTDSSLRDRAIRGRILDTDNFEFISFAPIQIEGLPSDPIVSAAEYNLTITGDLTVRDITQPTTFEAVISISEQNTITGTATTEISYPDFDLSIPSVPLVSDVSEQVTLQIDLVAEPNT